MKKKVVLSLVFVLGIFLFIVFFYKQPMQIPLSEEMIPHMPNLNWNYENPQTVYALFESGTENEYTQVVEGVAITAELESYSPSDVYTYYDNELKAQGFSQVSQIKSTEAEKNWVSDYKKGDMYYEVQYYPTPYNEESSTVHVFLGYLKE